ncbi:T9SS type B sorting domain-containing protein [Flavobacterium petrolei]|uniref:T9SS type B sorting domain-containing protein n=1 Tax=Flavobacterium petrolei TaxID=2259594 RepID=UPI003757DA71
MKKTTFLKVILLAFIFLQSFISFSQNLKPFTPRFDKDIKGDMLLIGNSILNRSTNNRTPNTLYNGDNLNSDFDMQFVNIDNGATSGVFNSSSAVLLVPNTSAPAAPCYKILYAALYWGAVTKGTTPITNIKFKMPTGGYNDIVGTVIHDSGTNVIGTSYPYACYADVTSLVTGAGNPNPEGTYTVANVSSKVGSNGGTGLSAGWSLYIVYEDPKLAAKSITSFDGFSAISSTENLDILVTGFRTIPTGPVRAKFAFSALEGDQGISGDYLTINGSILSAVNNAGTTIRGTNNFFNSSVTYIDPASGKTENFINRNPASTNTLGYDAGILEINNNGNAVIKNNDISAVIGLRSNQDAYFYYFNAISLEIIEPKIVLTKQVFSDATLTNNIGNANVTLGQELFYALGFQNIGNDDAKNFTIKDILPININFDPNNIIVPNGSGITYLYDAATRTIIFTVPSNLVEKNDPRYIIKFKVKVVPECNDLSDACSDKIQNQAFATYVGVTSNIKVDDQLSLSTFGECYLGTASPTNFLVGVENCIYTKDYQLCGASVVLTAANGYNSYSWSTSATGTPVIGTTQSITVSQTGTYYVTNTANAPCRSIKQVVTVSPSGTTVQNPVKPFADQVVQCPNNGKDLPKIFLCGANATRLINTGVTDAISIVWQKLDEASCTAIGTDDCANEKVDCKWDTIANGPNYTANTSGQFRVVFNYAGGCFNIFYFNVFKNLLNPTATSRDIICSTSGEIIVGGVPTSGYEFSLNASGPFQDSNVFSITTANTYTVYIRQKGIVSNPCLFSVPGIDILRRNFTVSEFISQPLCNGDKGSIKLAANDVRAQYFYSISKSGIQVDAVGPIAASDHTFSNLSPGTYDYEVKTDDGCLKTGRIVLVEPDVLIATVNQTKALTCETGEITVYQTGGTGPFAYYVNGSTTAQYSTVVNTPTAGNYSIRVVDYNGCIANTSIVIAAIPKPVYNTTGTNVNCYGDISGVINFNVTNANGYTLAYSTDNGVTYGSSAIISTLAPGTYNTILKYSLNGVDCFDTMKVITITQPAAAVTASMGVSELAGCGVPNKSDGKVRITNPQGGVAPYEYNFNNPANPSDWTTVNDAYKAPGTYTLYVRDFNKCVFSAQVTVDPEPVAPIIDVNTPVDFNCDGTATSTVTINNPGTASFTYNYYLDGTINPNTTSPNTFLNVAPGTHTVRVDYNLISVPTYSNLLKEDFGYGDDTTSPGINTAFYCFERQVVATQCKGSTAINDGDYSVTANIVNPFSAWVQPGDHTTQTVPPTPKGRSLVVNIGDQIATSDILYQKVINDIIPNQPINFELYAKNLLKTGNTQVNADLRVALVDAAGVEISSFATGDIPKTQNWEVYPKTPVTLNPGANTTLRFIIRSNKRATSGNDVAIDDIKVFQLPKSCITTRSFTVVVPTGKAFTAQIAGSKNVTCNGLTNGEITISATNFDVTKGYQYSTNNGATWSTALFTSPATISNLAGALYKVIVRPVGSTVAACAKPFDVTISAPTALTLSASVTKQATCTTGGTITAIGGGGTPAYQYELRQPNGITVVTAYSNNAGIFTNVPAGNYTVFLRDANTCEIPVGVSVNVTAPPALTAALATSTDYCYTSADPATLDVTATGGTGPFTYKLDGNAAISSALTSFSFANVAPGTHTILVTDSNNCTATVASIVIAPQIAFNVSLINDLTCLVNATIGNPVVTNGNGGPYAFTVTFGGTTTAFTFPYTASVAGNYVFTVTDSRGCPANSNTIVVTPKTTPAHITAKTDITCNGLDNGTITVTPSGGFTTTYTYAIKLSTVTTYTTQSTSQFTGLAAGIYDIKVIDSKGCESTPTQVTIINPTPIVPNASATAFSCNPTNAPQAATITVAPTGGTGAYSYSYDNGATFGSNTTLTVNDNGTTQTIRIIVRDANNCLSPMQAIVLAPLNKPTDLTFSNAAVTCTATTTTVSVTATNGVGALTFLITGTTSATNPSFFVPATTSGSTASFPGLLPGNYTFRVTDANGCYYTESHNIAAVTPIAVAANKTSDVLCQGGSTGSGTYTVSGNAGAYTFTVITGAIPPASLTQAGNVLTLSNATAGTYTVRVRDNATGCEADGTITINQPAAPLAITNAVATNFNCNNYNSQITVSASGGTTAYGYAAVASGATAPTSFASSNVVTVDTNNGTVLTWDVYVRDANGCTTSTPVTIAGDPAPGAPTVLVPNQCSATGSGFTIQVTAAAGSLAPLTYGIVSPTGAFQTGNTFNVAPGTYTVYVKDRNGCVSIGTAVTVAAQLTANAAVTKPLDCDPTNPDAIITTTINGGRAPFTYTVQKGTGAVSASIASPGTTFTTSVSNADADTYTFVITDANNCQTTTTATVTPITNPTVAATPTQVSCFGGANGAVTLAGSGGSGVYQYSFAGSPFTTTVTYSGLSANTPYLYQVRDSNSCVSTMGSIILTQPTAVSFTVAAAPFSCNTTTNASQSTTITVTPGGGTGTHSYSYDGGATFVTNPTRVVNDNGLAQTFNVIVRDANGCVSLPQAVVLAPLNKPTDLTFSNAAITCDDTTTEVTVTATNGAGSLSFLITGTTSATNPTLFSPATTSGATATFPGLLPGNYTFRVTDANGCFYTESHNIAPVTPIVVTPVKLSDVACFGNNTGSARFTVSGYNLPSNYIITVTTTPASLLFNMSPTGDVRTLTDLVAGTYTFTVTDNTTGCSDSESITINQPSVGVSITSATGTPVFCSNDNSQITINATGGTPSYGYAAVPNGDPAPTTFGTSNVVTVNTTGGTVLAWDVYVSDANGCVTPLPTTVNITNNGAPMVNATVANQCAASGSVFQIIASATGGLAPYTYTINTGVAPSPADTFTVAPGTYIITATDANGCPSTTSVTVNQRLTALAAVTKDITCAVPQEATIRVIISGGIAPFTYRVTTVPGTYSGGPNAVTGNSFIYTAPGITGSSYEFEITDANGTPACVAISNVVTTNTIVPVTATEVHVDPTCNGFTDGSIRLTATAGEAPFTYSISGVSGLGSSNVFGGLAAGPYNYIVRDAKGCDATGTIVLNDPAPVVAAITVNDITCNAADTPGSIEITNITGGFAPFTFTLLDAANNILHVENTSLTSFSFPNALNFGDYYVTVSDAKGCEFKSAKLRISSVPYLTFLPPSISGDCITGATVNLQIDTTYPTAPNYIYSIFGDPSSAQPATSSTSATFTGLNFGQTYFFQVVDNNNCTSIVEVIIDPLSPIKIDPVTITNVTCNTSPVSTNGAINFTVFDYSVGVTQMRFEILDQLTNQSLSTPVFKIVLVGALTSITDSFTGLSSGAYTLKVEEVDGTRCSVFYPFDITQPAQPLTSAVTSNVNANCNSGALVTLTTTGGTGPYTYAAAVFPAFSTTFTSGNVLTLNPGAAGTDLIWNITVRDVNGCTVNVPVTIAVDPSPVIALAVVNKCVAQGAYEIRVTETTAGTGAYSISVDGSTFTSITGLPHIVSGLNSGSHTIIIRDANGCTDTETILIDEPLVATPALTALPTCADNDGVITMTGTGGPVAGTYTYTIAPTAPSVVINNATGVISGLPAGTYTVTMTDTATPTPCTTTAVVTLSAAIPVTFTTATTPALCVGDSNGSITVTLLPGNTNPSYTYEIIAGPQLAVAQSSNIFTGLPAGTYTVRVNSGRGCSTDDATVVVAPATPLTANAAFPANTSCSNSTVITVTAGGGTGSGYTYNFNSLGFTAVNTFTVNNVAAPTPVTYIVRDANGCETLLQSITPPAFNPPADMNITGTPIYCLPATSTTSTVTINSVTAGVGPFTYQMLSPSVFNNFGSNSFAGLAAGDYMFQVTDANGCTYQELYTVAPRVNIAVALSGTTDITCFGANNGTANFTVSNSAGYTPTLTVGTGTLVFSGNTVSLTALAPGNYTLQVEDTTTGCTADVSFAIAEPTALDLNLVSNVNANCKTGAVVTVQGTGGTLNYTYAFVNDGVTPVATDYSTSPTATLAVTLPSPNAYDVWVQDANGCTFMLDVNVAFDAAPTIVAPAAQCFVGTPIVINLASLVTVLPVGPAQFYTVNGSNQTNTTYTITTPGTYNFSVTDTNGCISNSVTYTVVNQLIAGAILVKDLTCAPTPAATINVTITGGTGPFSYQMYNGVTAVGGTTAVIGTTFTANPTTAGFYSFVITDSYTPTCSVTTNTVELTTPVTPTFTAIGTDATCNGDSNGTVTVTPTAGLAPFSFALSGPAINNTGDTTGNYSGLAAGSYTVVITDAKGCTSVAAPAIVIDEPIVVSATISVTTPLSCGTGNVTQAATVTAVPSGGNGSYQYNFNNQGFTTNNTFVTNTAGPVSVLVRDTNGCSFATAVGTTVIVLDPPTNMDISGSLIYCAPATSTTSTVIINSVTAGVGPFTYQMLSPSVINNFGSNSFAGLAAGDYLFQVTDNNGCTYQELYTVAPRVDIAVTVAASTDETCFNSNDGTATFTVSNSAGYTTTLTVGTGTPVIAGNTVSLTALAPGNYTLQVLDSTTGCTDDVSFVIADIVTVLDFTTVPTNINCNVDTATITVTPVGGTPNYKYAVALATAPAPLVSAYSLSNTLVVDTNNGADVNWFVYVMDANGCSINKPQTILLDAIPTIATATATQCPSLTGTYDITVTASGFSPALEYSADGSNFQIGNVITVNAPGNYTITVRDANGCISAGTSVNIVDPLILTPVVSIPVSCLGGDGEITVSTTGGSGSYEYRIDSGTYPMTTPFAGLSSGAHTVYVRDTTTGCVVSTNINLQVATPITGFALAKTEVTCNNGNDGTITATMDTPAAGVNDNPVYTYVLSGTTTVTSTAVNHGPQDSPLFSGLAAGTYTVTVTSERGCTDDANITIVEPALIDVPAPTVVPFGCTIDNVGDLATITVTGVTGGSNSYLNYEFIKVGTPTNTQVQFGASNVYTEANLIGGSYIVNVYDDKGCKGTTTAAITIDPYIALDKVNVVIDQAITCNNLEDITVSATTIGVGTTNLEYTLVDVIYDPITGVPTTGSIYPAVPNNNGIFTGLPVGNYLITVRNLDTNCEIIGVHYVNEPNTFDLTLDSVVDVTCFSDINGSVNVTFVDRLITTTPVNGDDAGAFTYTLQDALGNALPGGTSTNAGPITISGLAAGTYTITATLSQSPSCTVSKNFTITGPTAALDITETHTEITCVTGNNDGTISVTAAGGWPGAYEYELVAPTAAQNVPYSAQTQFTGLTAGTYTINVRDSKGCVDFVTVTLANPTPIVATATPSTTLVSCFGDTSATITAGIPTGGSGNYLYSLVTTYPNGTVTTDGPQVSNAFTNLGAGSYQVQVTDSWTCSALSAAIVINEPAKVTASLALATAISCDVDATIILTASGGTAPYEYSTTSTFGTAIAMTGNTATLSVPVGTYNYYIRDVNGCESFISNDIKIDKVPDLVIDVNIQNAVINCKGDDSGVIVATAQGGLGNYVYTLLDGAGNALAFTPVQSSPGNFTNLPAGSYLVNVVSMDCEARTVVPVVIIEPNFPLTESNVVTNITCAGEGDGKIVITASGGTGIIKYAISPDLNQFFESNIFDNLKPGSYDYIVQDENGCYIYTTGVVITEPNSIIVTTIPGTEIPEVCAGDADGAFSINITGGSAPYSVSLDDVNGTYTPGIVGQTQFDFANLSGSEHIVYVRDTNSCTSEHTVILGEAVTLNPKATVNYDCVNNSASNSVTVTVDASNLPADLDYALDGSTTFQASNVFTNLTAGRHTIDVRHTNGCIKQVVFDILQVDPLTLTLADGGLNEIVATATGGGGNYQYTLDGESYGNKSNFIIYKSGDYTVTVTDVNGCTATATRYFEFIDIKIPNVFTPNGDGYNDTWAPTNTINYKDLVFDVFDRYGRKLGSYREGQFWDGKYNGTELPSGDYWYVIKIRDVKDAREFVGHFTLYR